jgi:MFS family permease
LHNEEEHACNEEEPRIDDGAGSVSGSEAGRQDTRARGLLAAAPDFWRLWFVGLVLFGVRWVETLAVAVFVYERTGSAFLVAVVTMLRVVPMGLFGIFIGAAADRVDRRRALVAVVALMLATSALLALLAFLGRLEVWHLALASFVNGVGWAMDNPVRRVMVGEVVGPHRMSAAMSVDVGTNNASRMLGPTIGGLLLAGVGIGGAFALSAALYAASLAASLALRPSGPARAGDAGPAARRIREGLMLVRRDPRLRGTLLITIVFNLFGWPFTSMVPVIAHDALRLGAEGIGIIASMEGVGALLGAVAIAAAARPAQHWPLFVGGTAIYFVMLTLFALAPGPILAGAALVLTGAAQAGFSVMQATLVYLAAPAEMRGRLFGLLSVCIGVGPLGFLHIGLLADAIGAREATVVSGLEGLAVLALTRRWWRAGPA